MESEKWKWSGESKNNVSGVMIGVPLLKATPDIILQTNTSLCSDENKEILSFTFKILLTNSNSICIQIFWPERIKECTLVTKINIGALL